jgi:hypothetical protein
MQYLFEPELIDLVDHDEEEFVMLRAIRSLTFGRLDAQEFVDSEIAGVCL